MTTPRPFVSLDGSGEGGGQILRTALSLALAGNVPFEMHNIRARQPRPGLLPTHVATIRAAMLASGARVHGAVDGSLDLTFEPERTSPGEFVLDAGGSGPAPLLLQTLAVPLALAGASRLRIEGGTHVPGSPSAHYLTHHWTQALEAIGLRLDVRIASAGFHPRGGGVLEATIHPWEERVALQWETRGALRRLAGFSGAGRIKADVAGRAREAAAKRLWEARRLEVEWTVEALQAPSPGSHAILVAEFEHGRAAFSALGERTTRPEILGDRLARKVLQFLDGEAAVDPFLADQLAVPLAVSGRGGRVTTIEVTRRLTTVVQVLEPFGYQASVSGRLGGPGALEVLTNLDTPAGGPG